MGQPDNFHQNHPCGNLTIVTDLLAVYFIRQFIKIYITYYAAS